MKLIKSSPLLLVLFCLLICGLNYVTVNANLIDTFKSIGESTAEAEYKSAIEVIGNYFIDIDTSRWTNVDNWYVKEEANELKCFMDDKENQERKLGLLNIKNARLLMLKELPYDYAEKYLPNRYMEQFSNKKVFYVAVDYKVYQENEYHINGVNYFFVVLVLEDNKWRIALTPLVPVNSIIFDGYGFGTEDEKTFDERRLKFHVN
ncbi:hypothetical protein [Sporosarcina koreensis]|uniref:hypothetical protein n=1 Tax=Sporosarcina koreensis TaxID=334735 RepID=UPI0036D289AE